MKTLGLILIGLGVVMMIYTGFTVITKKKVVDIGPVQIDKKEKTPVNWSPIVGGVLLVAGVVVMITDKNKN